MPNLYIIAGCNGAGKTTASYTILPEILDCREFVNADNIAAGLSPFNPESVALEAGRIMLARIRELIDEYVDFAFETTLATRSYVSLIKGAKKKGYSIILVFFGWIHPDKP
ncbi:Zeta toxin [Parapedobacter luteus]|uniref:Zeta toxin n=1 Tax=Parapedobacter luteus TaxID=623280 RepID=A0A1T5BH74_9SPHI|nr:zeta toxin family protein [Parapedobacter luteus]SKB46183.1 Zeta toxin [Parapedobacter luteus]